MSDATRRLLETMKRQWWVVVLTLAVAGSIPLLFLRDTDQQVRVFEARSTIGVEQITINEYTRLPIVDELLEDVQSRPFMEESAEALKLSAEDLRGDLRVYSVKSPQTAILVAYRSGESTEALRVSEAMAKRIALRAQGIAKEDIAQMRRQIRIINDGITELTGLVSPDDVTIERWKRADVARTLSGLRLQREMMTDQLHRIQQAYAYRPPSSVREVPRIQRTATGVAGALLGGLAAGLAIAAVREALWRRKHGEAAS